MSMPTFPDNGIDLTKEQAFHMLLGSIAMEELALSHIMNAEGEKLQYMLGTLHECERVNATPREILDVNNSITQLLEQVAENQYMLKSKLSQVLKAMETCGLCPGASNPTPPCSNACQRTICALEQADSMEWEKGTLLPWKPAYDCSGFSCWNPLCPAQVRLPPDQTMLLTFSLQLCFPRSSRAVIGLQRQKKQQWEEIMTWDGCTYGSQHTASVCGSMVLHPCLEVSDSSPIAMVLLNPCMAYVKQASLSLITM